MMFVLASPSTTLVTGLLVLLVYNVLGVVVTRTALECKWRSVFTVYVMTSVVAYLIMFVVVLSVGLMTFGAMLEVISL